MMASMKISHDSLIEYSDQAVTTFAPNHVVFVVPQSARVGSTHMLLLNDGRQVEYSLPIGTVPGETHTVRVDSGMMKREVTIVKKDGERNLGIVLTDRGDGRHPVVTKLMEEGAALELLTVGDVIIKVSEGPNVTAEATDAEALGRLLRSARGTLKLQVLRPEKDVPTRVLHSCFLSKRSPKSVLGNRAWQRRWFELDPEKITYWELQSFKKRSYLGSSRGAIALADVVGVRLSADPKAARFVNVLMKNQRMFELLAPNATAATSFAEAVRLAMIHHIDAHGVSTKSAVDVSDAVPQPPLEKWTTVDPSELVDDTGEPPLAEPLANDALAQLAVEQQMTELVAAAGDLTLPSGETRERASTSIAY